MHLKGLLVGAAVLGLWAVGPLFAEVGGEEANKDLKKLQGTWAMVSGEKDGKKAADEHVTRSKIIFEGDKGLLVVPNQTGETIIFEIVKIDPTKTPKEMHFIRRGGPNAGKTIIAVYRFEGDDLYHFAFDPTGGAVLKQFITEQGTGHVRNTWKRVKP